MCRLALKSADTPFSPYEVLTAMEAMQEGYDGSGTLKANLLRVYENVFRLDLDPAARPERYSLYIDRFFYRSHELYLLLRNAFI